MTNKTERFTLRLTSNLKAELCRRCEEDDVSLNALVCKILQKWVRENGGEKTVREGDEEIPS